MLIENYFQKFGIEYDNDFSTAKLSSIKTGGIAKHVVYPKTIEEFVLSIRICRSLSERYKIIGGCTNTFFSDDGFDGAVILTKRLTCVTFFKNEITAEAGLPLTALLKKASYAGIELKSELFGIPGSLGGAVRNNAGAFNASISEIFAYGSFYDLTSDRIFKADANDLGFSYRNSILQSRNIVFLNGVFKGKRSQTDNVSEKFNEFLSRRRESQPKDASLGSFFKRSNGIIPAILIDKAGLKGKGVGRAKVSEKHAGFIINTGGATSSDVDMLANTIEHEILNKYGIALVREAEFVN